jgi:hypothetical protein
VRCSSASVRRSSKPPAACGSMDTDAGAARAAGAPVKRSISLLNSSSLPHPGGTSMRVCARAAGTLPAGTLAPSVRQTRWVNQRGRRRTGGGLHDGSPSSQAL